MDTIIIFQKNLTLGKVKTRLAKTIGDEKALAAYLELISYTAKSLEQTEYNKVVYFSEQLEPMDAWNAMGATYKVQLQHPDLGERMIHAITEELKTAKKVILIGSDCPYIQPRYYQQAFNSLAQHSDMVVGPSHDGGFYLIGTYHGVKPEHFEHITWSTDLVCKQLLANFKKHNVPYTLLPTLNDIDEEKDWVEFEKFKLEN